MLCHNGKPFTEADIQGICGIRSTKDEPESGKIGRFGIGFKSVYAYTKTPQIYSGQYSFRICNLVLPYAEENEATGDDTILILPFDGEVNPETAYNEIGDALKKYLSSDVLFALCNVRNISCKIYPDENEWSVSKEFTQVDNGVDKVLLTQKNRGNVPAEVFEKIGCNVGIKDVFVDHYAYNNHLRKADASFFEMLQKRVLYKRCQRVDYPETWDMYHSIDHLQDILCSNSVEMSVKVVDLINEKVKKHPLYGKMTGSHSKAFNTTTTDSVNHIPSMLALELSSTKWLYDKTGTLQSPSDIKKSDLAVQYSGHGAEIFAQLPFKVESEAVETVIQSVEEPYQAFISAMLKKPDELRLMCEAYQKLQKKRQKGTDKTQSLTELLEKQSSAQTEVEAEPAPDDETLGEYGAVRNLKHREKKLEENFQEGLEGQKTVAPRLRYTCSESNHEEKAFLRAQYFGKCQICGKQIIRYDGKPYFEACNILPTDSIPTTYKQSISEGWNSLCLCPNCAAEFRYGKKNLSELVRMIQTYNVEEEDENLIVCDIEMQGEKRTIKYTGKHFLALQKAIGFYDDYIKKKTDTVKDESDG